MEPLNVLIQFKDGKVTRKYQREFNSSGYALID